MCVKADTLRGLLKGTYSDVADGRFGDVGMRCVCLHANCRKGFWRTPSRKIGLSMEAATPVKYRRAAMKRDTLNPDPITGTIPPSVICPPRDQHRSGRVLFRLALAAPSKVLSLTSGPDRVATSRDDRAWGVHRTEQRPATAFGWPFAVLPTPAGYCNITQSGTSPRPAPSSGR